jgi:hypothetical protein
MSVSLEKPSSLASHFRDALPSLLKKSRNTEIWGVDLKHAEWQVQEVILEKVFGLLAPLTFITNLIIVSQTSFCSPSTSSVQGKRLT